MTRQMHVRCLDRMASRAPFFACCLDRRRFQSCPGELAAAGHKDAKEMFDVVAPPMHEITSTRLMDNGEYR